MRYLAIIFLALLHLIAYSQNSCEYYQRYIDIEDEELKKASGANYAAGHNHGLFQDEGTTGAPASRAAGSAGLAGAAPLRLRATLHETVGFAEGAHLEHSVAHQFAILDLVARLARNVSELPELAELGRMRRTAAWRVNAIGPDGEIALAHGRDEPRLGWTFPGDGERTTVWSIGVALPREGDGAGIRAVVGRGARGSHGCEQQGRAHRGRVERQPHRLVRAIRAQKGVVQSRGTEPDDDAR